MNSVHVRGQLGVQILEAFVGLAASSPGEPSQIVVNAAGLEGPATRDLISGVIKPRTAAVVSPGTAWKTPYWNPGCAMRLFRNRERVLADHFEYDERATMDNVAMSEFAVVHVRGTDKPVASYASHCMLYDEAARVHGAERVIVCGDDSALLARLAADKGARVSMGETHADWRLVARAPNVYCAPSAFPFSTLVVAPSKTMTVLGPRLCDGGYPHVDADLTFIREAAREGFCRNITFME